MTFGEALEQMMKGRVVSRRSWPGFARNRGVAVAQLVRGDTRNALWPCGPKGWIADGEWLPRADDIFAIDWENVEAERPPV